MTDPAKIYMSVISGFPKKARIKEVKRIIILAELQPSTIPARNTSSTISFIDKPVECMITSTS